jgi:hypothetical protein
VILFTNLLLWKAGPAKWPVADAALLFWVFERPRIYNISAAGGQPHLAADEKKKVQVTKGGVTAEHQKATAKSISISLYSVSFVSSVVTIAFAG